MLKVNVDKRFEIITGLVLAYVSLYQDLKSDYDWIEIPENEYVKELINKINISKHPEIEKYINGIIDYGEYSELFLYFDDKMNFNNQISNKTIFKDGTLEEFSALVKKIYDNENLESVFLKFNNEFLKIEEISGKVLPVNFDINDIEIFYGYKEGTYAVTLSILANGGFGFSNNGELNYFKGVRCNNGKYEINEISFLIDLFHEYSHSYINKLVDKYFYLFDEIDFLLNSSIESGLPKCYQHPKTLLYEYLVRTNSIILSNKYLSEEILSEDVEWYEQMGFSNIKEFIEITLEKRFNYDNYEEFFIQEIIPHINELSLISKNIKK